MIELFTIGKVHIYLLNIAFVAISLLFVILSRKWIKKNLVKFLDKRDWNTINEDKLVKLLLQIIYILGVIMIYRSLAAFNPVISVKNILAISILDLSHETIKNGAKIREGINLTVGKLVTFFVILFFAKIIFQIFRIAFYKSTKDKEWIDESRRYTIVQLSKYFIFTFAILAGLSSAGIPITLIYGGATAILVGLGLGLQEMFTDVVSGFILLVDGSVRVNDIVEIGDVIAKVEKINIRTSFVKTMDGKTIIVPNSKLTEENVINWTVSEHITRFHVSVGVAYGSDTEKVKNLLYKVALDHPLVDKRRKIVVMFQDFGDSSLKFDLFFWAARSWEIMVIKSDIRFAIDKAFRENDIQIPFPQRDLHIKSDFRANVQNQATKEI